MGVAEAGPMDAGLGRSRTAAVRGVGIGRRADLVQVGDAVKSD